MQAITSINIAKLFAHSGELHQSRFASQIHSYAWYVQLPLFLCIVGIVYSLTWLMTKKISSALLVTSFMLLVIGFGSYQMAPLISILAITTGLAATLFLTLVGIEAKEK